MIHPTYRSLDAPVKFGGFAARQWAWMIVGGGSVIGLVYVSGLAFQPALSLCVIVIGPPVALAYVGAEGGFSAGQMMRDLIRFRLHTRTLAGGGGGAKGLLVEALERPAAAGAAGEDLDASGDELEKLWAA